MTPKVKSRMIDTVVSHYEYESLKNLKGALDEATIVVRTLQALMEERTIKIEEPTDEDSVERAKAFIRQEMDRIRAIVRTPK